MYFTTNLYVNGSQFLSFVDPTNSFDSQSYYYIKEKKGLLFLGYLKNVSFFVYIKMSSIWTWIEKKAYIL